MYKWKIVWHTNRMQGIALDRVMQVFLRVTSGVPQGLALSPTFFIVYRTDLELDITAKVPPFADHTKRMRTITEISTTTPINCRLREGVNVVQRRHCTVMHVEDDRKMRKTMAIGCFENS